MTGFPLLLKAVISAKTFGSCKDYCHVFHKLFNYKRKIYESRNRIDNGLSINTPSNAFSLFLI